MYFRRKCNTIRQKLSTVGAGRSWCRSAGVAAMMDKAESKPGEKTILDALVPGSRELAEGAPAAVAGELPTRELLRRAAEAAAQGSESTREMEAVHGRAAYSASRSIGVLDGGSVVGRLIFEGAAAWAA
ncbi:DAK2 domain-containing protein [Actinomyces sp. MRS3W]|uniref:DAK2 domain-containing protein n=1 Tax=Actinomyces sp. MRS3W TaxID=2800796 RepID=UPI0028FD89FD|nr:DAK2 domain-containing protein [Actinomyces sp. MRS3W]MDU0349626.1 DAK2 domain-containing protein [Actinomyces sp. MRS3W]